MQNIFGNLSFVTKMIETVTLRLVTEALTCPKFASEMFFVHWYSGWITSLQSWSGSCACHIEQFNAGIKVACDKKGRLLHICYEYAMKHFKGGLLEAEEWRPCLFQNDIQFLQSAIGCVRFTVEFGMDHVQRWLQYG